MTRPQALVEYLSDVPSLAVVCHDNPDPDAIGSAFALRVIADRSGVERVDILYGGTISHQQNRAFVNLLDIEMTPISAADVDAYDRLAFVDHTVPGGHTELHTDRTPDIVVDHHPTAVPVHADFADVRDDYGATATILAAYLRDLEIELTTKLATALLFALHRERIDYVRTPTDREYEAALYLCPAANMELLRRLYGAAFTPATLDAIGDAIANRESRGSRLVSFVRQTTERDALVQAADYLLNVEGVDTVLVFGVVGREIQLSARSIDSRIHLGAALRAAFGDVGSAGGHEDMAGATIPLGLFADVADDERDIVALAAERISNRFFEAVGNAER